MDQQKRHFEGVSGDYHACRQHPNHVLFKDLLWGTFLRNMDFLRRPGLRVLEPMCGFADGKRLLEQHLRVPIRYAGFDISEPLVAAARAADPRLAIEVQDATTFTPTDSCDLLMILGGLHHVPHHYRTVVERLGSAVAPGGWCINFEPTDGNPLNRAVRRRIYARNPFFDAQTERAFRLAELDDAFATVGLRVADRLHCGLLSYILYCNPDCFPRLNRGGARLVRGTFGLDRLFFRSTLGRLASFATLTLYRKDMDERH